MLIIIIIATFRFLSHAHKLLSIHSIHSLSYHTLTCQDTAWHLNIHFLFTRQSLLHSGMTIFLKWRHEERCYFNVTMSLKWVPSVLWHCWLGVRKSIRPKKIGWWGVGVVIRLERGTDCLHMVQLMPLHPKTPSSLASFKSRLVLPFWYQLTQVVLERRPLNGCCSSSSSSSSSDISEVTWQTTWTVAEVSCWLSDGLGLCTVEDAHW